MAGTVKVRPSVRVGMAREVKLNHLNELLDELSYPATPAEVADEYQDVVLLYADGDEPLPDALARIDDDEFHSAEDLQESIMNALPTESVGEPGQSEGEG